MSLLSTGPLAADEAAFADSEILHQEPHYRLELVETRVTAYAQRGYGYQSQAGGLNDRGSETLHVLELQSAFVVQQGQHVTHRLWVPVDVVTSASANASDRYYATPDVVSSASAQNVSADANYQITLEPQRGTSISGGVGFHHEENFRSWLLSLEYQTSLADDNAVLSAGASLTLDWFDAYALGGKRIARTSRVSSNANLGLSQLLSPTTILALGYGITLQQGELSNTWNSVPKAGGGRTREELPRERQRHAASLRVSQWLPWDGALKLGYRAYLDDWDVRAHSVEGELEQRALPWLVLSANYRYHWQTGVRFFTTSASPGIRYLSADSDLAPLHAQTVGGSMSLHLHPQELGSIFLNFGYDRYFRSDGLSVDIATCASGFRF